MEVTSTAISKNGVPVRLTEERWLHITTSHRELDSLDYQKVLEAIENPDAVFKGNRKELLAVRKIDVEKWLVVPYKEISKTDGFVLTAYIATRSRWLLKKEVIWSKD